MSERCNWLPVAIDRSSNFIAVEPSKPSSLHQFIHVRQHICYYLQCKKLYFMMNVQYYAYLRSHLQTQLLRIHQHWSHDFKLAQDSIRTHVHWSLDPWAWVAAWCLCETPLGFWNTLQTPKRFRNRQDCTTDQSWRRLPATPHPDQFMKSQLH